MVDTHELERTGLVENLAPDDGLPQTIPKADSAPQLSGDDARVFAVGRKGQGNRRRHIATPAGQKGDPVAAKVREGRGRDGDIGMREHDASQVLQRNLGRHLTLNGNELPLVHVQLGRRVDRKRLEGHEAPINERCRAGAEPHQSQRYPTLSRPPDRKRAPHDEGCRAAPSAAGACLLAR